MARILNIEIANFRAIRSLTWRPTSGVNCLIGPGDSGKSTLLDAIELCLAGKRNPSIGDTDFWNLDVSQPISITVTLGRLPQALLSLEMMPEFLRGFDPATGVVEDEPRHDLETAVTLNFTCAADLDPVWSLISERNENEDFARSLGYRVRTALAAARLSHYSSFNLSWSRGSLLNRLSDERANVGGELAEAARHARTAFGDRANAQLADTLKTVTVTARNLGVDLGGDAQALLDAHSVSFDGGTIALHNQAGIPLRNLGTGSGRLLVGGLQRAAADTASILLVDEVEYGLEPHRVTRLLVELGAKSPEHPLQVFMTTHSPVVLQELSGSQLNVVRALTTGHEVRRADSDAIQGPLRSYPHAFLAKRVIVCEGATEVGLVRGLDLYHTDSGELSLLALGVAYVDSEGGEPDRPFIRAMGFQQLGFEVMTLIDHDQVPTPAVVAEFVAAGGAIVQWRAGRALEDELFICLPDAAVGLLLARAKDLHGKELVNDHIRSKTDSRLTLTAVEAEGSAGSYCAATREELGKASRTKQGAWFKSVGKMEGVARHIVGPHLAAAQPEFRDLVNQIFRWATRDA